MKSLLKERIREFFNAAPASSSRRAYGITRIEIEVEPTDPLEWLSRQSNTVKVYWRDRDSDVHSAGYGIADCLHGADTTELDNALRKMTETLSAHDGSARYYGGIRFDIERQMGDLWRDFGGFRFILPRFELTIADHVTKLACNICGTPDENPPDFCDRILEELDAGSERIPSVSIESIDRRDSPEFEGWSAAIEAACALFDDGVAQKIVLARQTSFNIGHNASAIDIMRRMRAVDPHAYHFYFQPRSGAAFFGASPERLFAQRGTTVESEAVAGTRKRGASSDEDILLGEELLNSEKDVREHDFVSRRIHEIFCRYCNEVEIDAETGVLLSARVQHLYKSVRGALRNPHDVGRLALDLHPTPAVGGVPSDIALREIAKLESFDRGWYAGPIGWIGKGGAEFAVGIRSALAHEGNIYAYTGAGIVRGSDAQKEWDELELKLSALRQCLTPDQTELNQRMNGNS